MNQIYVHTGPAAINTGTAESPQWVGVASGNVRCIVVRATAEDARRAETNLPNEV